MWLVIAAAYQVKGKKALTGSAQNSSCRSPAPAPAAPQSGSPCGPMPPHKDHPCRSPHWQRSQAAAGAPPAPTKPETLPSERACPLSHAEDMDLCKSHSKRNAFHSLRVAFVVIVPFFHLYRKKQNTVTERKSCSTWPAASNPGMKSMRRGKKRWSYKGKNILVQGEKHAWVNDTA